jgi:hypothetical protein
VSRARQRFRQTDVTKAVKGAVSGGLTVGRVEISPEGHIVVIAGKPEEGQTSAEVNPWHTIDG